MAESRRSTTNQLTLNERNDLYQINTHTQMQKEKALEKRQYQEDDYKCIIKALETHAGVIYQLPTGGGKSVIISQYIIEHKNENIIIFAHKRRLLTQLYNRLKDAKVDVGILAGSLEENFYAKVLIVSIRTAVKDARLELLMQRKWTRAVIDEARHSRTNSYDKVLDTMREAHPDYKLFGVDATPFRKDRRRLDKHFQHMVVSKEDVKSLTEKGYLQRCKVIQTPIDKEALKEQVKEVGNDYQMGALSDYMRQPKYLEYVVNNYKENGEGRQAIAFAVDKAHAKDLKAEFIKGGFKKIAQIDSDMSTEEVEKAFADFESEKIQILINIEMATEGVDLPNCGCIIGARPTKSLTLYLQMGGRGTRPDGKHDYFILLDCCGWTDEFGTLASKKHWSLNPEVDPNNPRKKNKVVGRKPNGELTEDLTDFVGELIELTPEEYMTQLKGGLEVAAKANKSIEEKIKDLYEELRDIVKGTGGKGASEFQYKPVHGRNGGKGHIVIVTANHKMEEDWDREHRATISLEREANERYYVVVADPENSWYNRSRPIEEFMKLTTLAGEMNNSLLNEKEGKKVTQRMLEVLEQIVDLESSKINLNDFKEAAKKHQRGGWEKKVNEHAATGGIFTFDREVSAESHFKGASWSTKIIGLKMKGTAINNYHNKVTLILKDRYNNNPYEDDKNYVKGEKVFELIEDGGWEIEMLKVPDTEV
jgi:superfamily II DNA or RNA helicase